MSGHSGARLFASSALAVTGGALMMAGGLANHSFLLSTLHLVGGEVSAFLGGVPGLVVLITILLISILIGLGGFTVLIGGILIYIRHTTAGRLLIAFGGGTGLIGLLFSFGYAALTTGVAVAASHSIYWFGLAMAVVARRVKPA